MLAADVLVAQNIGFGIIAVIMVVGALRVVTTSNVVHAALWLVTVLAGAAAQYVLLAAEFVAVTQVLVYIVAFRCLVLFGTMLRTVRTWVVKEVTNQLLSLGVAMFMCTHPYFVVLFSNGLLVVVFTVWRL